jgi:hypothetical protein
MENRENRVPVMMTVTIGAGNFMFEGMVANISRNGFMVEDVPLRFNSEEKKISAVISCRQGVFKMKVRPTWLKVSGMMQTVGFEILGYGADWTKLLNILDPVNRGALTVPSWTDNL